MKKRISICIAGTVLILTGCYKNSVEELSNPDGCNTINISYSKDIRPIINISCNLSGCHNAGSTTTFSLVAYEELKAQADNGLLLKSINHESGAVAMPKGTSKLSACTISKITAWVNAGALNN